MFSFKGFLSRNTGFAWARRSLARTYYAALSPQRANAGMRKMERDIMKSLLPQLSRDLAALAKANPNPYAFLPSDARPTARHSSVSHAASVRKVATALPAAVKSPATSWARSIPRSRSAATRANGGLRGSTATRTWRRYK